MGDDLLVEDVAFEGTKVRLRDWRIADHDLLRALLAPERPWHDTNGPYFGRPSRAETDSLAVRLTQATDNLPTPRSTLAVVERGSDQVIGRVSWYWESKETDWRRLGLAIYDENRWCGGYGTEALYLWTSYLFSTTDALRLDFATFSGNPGMIAVGRRLGFIEEGRFRLARRWSGGIHDSVVYGVLRSEWESLHGTSRTSCADVPSCIPNHQ
jgi:RimJ/RimL family protein N-acetyltransferase